jgi:aquaporin Z
MPIRVFTGKGGLVQMKASFTKNRKHYLQEAAGIAIFMISACFFGALLEANGSWLHKTVPDGFIRSTIMGLLMGTTALFIFYSPLTAPSGSQINPAVTLAFIRANKMCPWDGVFYMMAQFAGGLLAVYTMQWLMGPTLTAPPVSSVATVPGKWGIWPALMMEFCIAFITMTTVLFTSADDRLKKYTRLLAGCLVCAWVIVAGPVSGFGMNPARSFASALPAHTWTAFWIYLLAPVGGMLCAAELYLRFNKPVALVRPTGNHCINV